MGHRRQNKGRLSMRVRLYAVVVLFLFILCIVVSVPGEPAPEDVTKTDFKPQTSTVAATVQEPTQEPTTATPSAPSNSTQMAPQQVLDIKHYLKHVHPLPFYGSLDDLRHSAIMNTKVLMAAADIFNKYYDFNFPPLSTENIFIEEYTDFATKEFMDELTLVADRTRAAYASASSSMRPIVVFLAHKSIIEFQQKIEKPEYADLKSKLVASAIIVITEGTDEVASFVFQATDSLESFLNAPYLRMWFVQNCDIHHPKVRPLPISTNHHASDALPSYDRETLTRKVKDPYLRVQKKETANMISQLQMDDKVLQGLNPGDVDRKWRIVEECDTETLRGAERRTLNHSGASHSPCLLKELGDQCEVVLLAANVRSMSSQDRCGVLGRDRAHFEQITGLADKPRLAVFVQQPQAAGGLPTVYLPLVDLYYIFMASTLGHPRRKMRIYGAFSTSTNQTLRSRARADMLASGLGDFQVSSRAEDRRRLSEYAFTASPIGNGYDCHRTWEALLAGSIPIVNSPRLFNRQTVYNSTAMADIFADLPIFVVDSYRDLTEATLKAWASEVRAKAARGEYKFEKLFSYHYLNEIRKLF